MLLQLVEEGATQDAAFMAAAPVRRGRLAALLNVFDWLLRSKQVLSAANLVLELVRCAFLFRVQVMSLFYYR